MRLTQLAAGDNHQKEHSQWMLCVVLTLDLSVLCCADPSYGACCRLLLESLLCQVLATA